ncbi:MAG: acyl CoA:acetate/3-ketoacid CoA transferase [Beutenbergiaceae bacterium]
MRFCSASQAVAAIADGATVLVDGSGGGVNEPGAVLAALRQRFADQAQPANLTLVHVSGMGSGHDDGADYFASRGMVRRVIGGHWAWGRGMQELAADEDLQAYCLPQGTISHLLRDIAAGRPGHLSRVGLGTFVDPRMEGGRLNESAAEPINQIVNIGGEEFIFTPAFPIDVAIIRATTADEDGNLTMEGEGLFAETLASAQAAKNSGGIVIAQVRQAVPRHSIPANSVRVPGVLIDAVVVDPTQRLSFATDRDRLLEGAHWSSEVSIPAIALSERKVIGRRAAAFLRHGDVVNLGFGMPDAVAAVLAEEDLQDAVTFTVEQGHVGGVPAGGSDFGLARNHAASLDAGAQFDWYDGGGIDTAVLSFAEIDRRGNVNVSRFGRRMPGIGGFVNISQGARRVIFVGTFVAKGSWQVGEGAITLPQGGIHKLIDSVQQVSFSAEQALRDGRPVVYVTERAVFELTENGPRLIEIAPGIDLQRDVLALMGFVPEIADDLATMDTRLFTDAAMALQLQHR